MTPRVEQQLGAVRFAIERTLPKHWNIEEIARRTDYRGNEALCITLSNGERRVQGKHEFDELPADLARHYFDRITHA